MKMPNSQTWTSSRSVNNDGVRLVSMSAIAGITRRLDYMMGLISQQELKSDINLRESAAKKGLFVDPFLDDSTRDAGITQTAAIVNGELVLPVFALGQSNIPPLAGNAGKYLGTADGITLGFIGGALQWTVISAQTNAVAGGNYLANSANGSFPVVLPATPNNNDTVRIADGGSSFAKSPVTVVNNGNLLMGSLQNLLLDVNNASITLVFNTTLGWRII